MKVSSLILKGLLMITLISLGFVLYFNNVKAKSNPQPVYVTSGENWVLYKVIDNTNTVYVLVDKGMSDKNRFNICVK